MRDLKNGKLSLILLSRTCEMRFMYSVGGSTNVLTIVLQSSVEL